MKRLLSLLGVIATLMIAVTLGSCNHRSGFHDDGDSTAVGNQPTEQTFASVNEVLLYQQNLAEDLEMQDIFLSMKRETIEDVVNVLKNREVSITVKNIVNEYRAGKQIYDNLETPNDPKQDNDTLEDKAPTMEESQKPVLRVSYRKDTIDGKPVIVKEEVTEDGK